jgi:hypothetical protein
MSRSKTRSTARLIAVVVAAAAFGAAVGGCSDLYTDRRNTISLGAGDAIAANEVAQMVDPWPPHSGNKNIAFNGQKMQSAVERYRTNKVYPPANITNSALESLQESQASAPSGSAPAGGAPAAGGAPSQ